MKNKKYCIALLIFSLLQAISLINIDRNIDSILGNDEIPLSSNSMQQVLFKAGMVSGPHDLDPVYAWDYASYDVIDQVCEGLFAYNLSESDNSIIPNLALSGTWNPAGTEYTCILRQGVTFHDGASFNADAVKWNFERLNWFINGTGTLPLSTGITQTHSLYKLADGRPIVSSVTKNNDYNITFVLNDPYAPFESLLGNVGSYMLSPSSTPATAYIDTTTGDLVGTGPFVYDNYTADVEVNFHAFDNYWKGKANITAMKFQIIEESTARHNALLDGDVHFITGISSSWYSIIKADPNLTFLNTSTTSHALYYLGMNNHRINRTFREAISYAIDYDYIINELQDNVERLMSPIPNGVLYANDTFNVPTLNLTRARLVMQSMGFGVGLNVSVDGPDEATWRASTFISFTYTYNVGNSFREDLGVLLADNLGKIGIDVIDEAISWSDFLDRVYGYGPGGYDSVELFWIGWGADYNDPSNLLNILFTNRSVGSNSAQYDGYQAAIEAGRNPLDVNDNVQLLMEAALSEVDPVSREALYDRIQELLIEEDYPWAWGYSPYVYNVYDKGLTGFQQNAMRKSYFYPCIWNKWIESLPILPGPFSIFSDADDPDTDGNFNITWSPSAYADNYSLYMSSSVITEINEEVTVLLDEITDLSYEAIGYSDGTYYFLVVARNGDGNTTSSYFFSSNLMITVEIEEPEPGPPPWIPGFELWTMFFTVSSVGLILLLRKKKKIT